MYESHFGLREKPFSLLPDPEYLYLGRGHAAALASLEYGLLTHAGFTVITGEIGCGKTTLIRYLLNQIGRDVTVGLITNTHPSFGELLQWILPAFGLEYRNKDKVERYQTFVEFLIDEYSQKRRTVLIIDEAQNLDMQTLEELRMLSNINADKDLVLQLILLGQPQVRGLLRRPELAQFSQRVAVDFHLQGLDVKETREYIRHRLRIAGGEPSIFRGAYELPIHGHTGGTPRLINLLCDTALVYAYAARRTTVTPRLVEEVIEDKLGSGVHGFNRPLALQAGPGQEDIS